MGYIVHGVRLKKIEEADVPLQIFIYRMLQGQHWLVNLRLWVFEGCDEPVSQKEMERNQLCCVRWMSISAR